MSDLSEKAKEQRTLYQRAYRRRNPDKQKEYIRRYWEKKAAAITPATKVRQYQELGFSQREIATLLGLSLGTVNNYLNSN